MIIPTFILTIFIVLFTLLLVIFIILGLSYAKLIKQLHQKEESRANSHLQEKHIQNLLTNAKEQANTILKDAGVQANMLLGTTVSFSKEAQQLTREKLSQIVTEQQNAIAKLVTELGQAEQQAIQHAADKDIQTIQTIAQDITAEAEKEIRDFRSVLQRETLSAQRIISSKLEQENTQLEKELVDYKSNQMQKIDDAIVTIIGKVAKQTLGKTISEQEHSQLIVEALKNAKNEGVL
ncbi:MAG TPA: hypothetical protein VJC10_00110 [Patescibacteria group bacterium]|nr:hypothetical protein [Patescibacteria group bacterium]